MPEEFIYDVFLSHSAKDNSVVREIAERLKSAGLRVWFDLWEIGPGDGIPAKIEEGLERSRILVFCMSANAFGPDWAQLEAGTFRFRDPLNKGRRFIPLRLDDAPIKGSLAQFLASSGSRRTTANWSTPKLLRACRPPARPTKAEAKATGISENPTQLGSPRKLKTCAFSPDGKRFLTGADDRQVRLWDIESKRCLLVLEGHTDTGLLCGLERGRAACNNRVER